MSNDRSLSTTLVVPYAEGLARKRTGSKRPIADARKTCQLTVMDGNSEQIASDWIAYALLDPSSAPDDIHQLGWVLYDASYDRPLLAWTAIKAVVGRYPENGLFSDYDTEAKRILARLAAGPLENLLAEHGTDLIEIIEAEARRDRCMFWTLGCVWQNSMSDEVWARVQRSAGGISR